jgi:transcriptional regulator with XRE-family HTH domain
MADIRDVIRRRSRALGLTQQVLADRTGVHVRQIRRYENG